MKTPEPNPPNALRWKTGTPDVPNGKMENFWCCINTRDGKNFHRFLCYGNAYEMPLGDDCYDPPKNAVPVGDDGDYAWTGWFSESCEHCDTQWSFDDEVIAWARLPKFEPTALTPPAVEKAATEGGTPRTDCDVSQEAKDLAEKLTPLPFGQPEHLERISERRARKVAADALEIDKLLFPLENEVIRLKQICANAGIGDYKANYFLGELTETGMLREQLATALRDINRDADTINQRNGLIHKLRSMLREAGFPDRVKWGEDLHGNEDWVQVRVEVQLKDALDALRAAKDVKQKVYEALMFAKQESNNHAMFLPSKRARNDAAIRLTIFTEAITLLDAARSAKGDAT